MWFIVKTDVFSEQQSIDFLREKYNHIITDFYFPLGRKTYKNENGEVKVRFVPVLQGMFFIRVQNERRLKKVLSPYGYFMYKGFEMEPHTSELVERTFFTKAHILTADSKQMSLDEIVRQSKIPDDDMETFVYFNDRIGDDINGLSIVEKRYSDLVKENDTIRILSGPLAGRVGVVKQIKHKGKKDRHLLVRFGNNYCLSISNIRQYALQIEHEAPSESVGAWRAIDQMIGYLQMKEPSKNAGELLRKLFMNYQKKLTIYHNRQTSDIAYSKMMANRKDVQQQEVLENLDESMWKNFRILANYLPCDNATLEQGLKELIPDVVLRPFLTPASGIDIAEGQGYHVLQHNGITEFIFPCNLREFFRGKEYEADKYAPVFDEDYEYDAHFALLKTVEGKVKAICSWGGFYDNYASQSKDERALFLSDLEAKKYSRLLYLLTQSDYRFEKIDGIGGFSLETGIEYTDDMEELGRRAHEFFTLHSSLFTSLTAAAVEVWQGARLLIWRKYLQRYVLLHKVPVIDQPSVITVDSKQEDAFAKTDGKSDMTKIAAVLNDAKEIIENHLAKEEMAYAILRFLSTSLVFSSHFAEDELYNYITDSFHPDNTLSELFHKIVGKITQMDHSSSIVSHLHKGMVELQEQDSWIYFKFPSYLKQIQAIDKMVKNKEGIKN